MTTNDDATHLRGARLGGVSDESRRVADALPHLVAITDADGRLAYVNRVWSEYTGLDFGGEDDLWRTTIHPDDVAQVVTGWNNAVACGQPYETAYRIRRHDGVYRWFLNRAIPIRDDGGAIVRWLGTATDIDDRARTEELLRVIAEPAASFGEELDIGATMQRVADVAVRSFADWCAVYVFDERGRLRPLASAHADPVKAELAREALTRFPPLPDGPLARVGRSGAPLLLSRISTDFLEETTAQGREREFALTIGYASMLGVPLDIGERMLGVVAFANGAQSRTFETFDLEIATMLCRRASIALGNARLYERRDRIAQMLQHAYLPQTLPALPGARLAAYYAPGGDEAEIGGDWYDAFTLEDGSLFFSIGDVAGRGLTAAVPMGKMRQAFRALTTIERDPRSLLQMADAVLRREHPDVFVTAIAGVFDPQRRMLTYAAAGHPAPFVRSARGDVRVLPGGGVPLGLQHVVAFENERVQLAPGELVVFVTDGVLESRRNLIEGEARVLAALADPAFAVASEAAALLRAIAGDASALDDTAILTVALDDGYRWRFDARDRIAAQRARDEFVAARRAAGVDEARAFADEIVFGELIGNVARYTPGGVDVVLRDGAGAQLEVVDRGPAYRWTGALPDNALSENGRGQFLIGMLGGTVALRHIPRFGNYAVVNLTGRSPR